MRLKTGGNWISFVLWKDSPKLKITKLQFFVMELKKAHQLMLLQLKQLRKVTLLVDEAATKKEKIEATIELRKAKARLQAVA